jgi:hypothetical protein
VVGEVTADTHCNTVPPYSREVIQCVKAHDERCAQEGVAARAAPPLRTVSRIGLPLSALAQALALPAPAKVSLVINAAWIDWQNAALTAFFWW